jgi:hypothetical protein
VLAQALRVMQRVAERSARMLRAVRLVFVVVQMWAQAVALQVRQNCYFPVAMELKRRPAPKKKQARKTAHCKMLP